MEIDWMFIHYDDLTINDLHDLVALRLKVFVVEQNCPYQDLDGKDKHCHHLIGKLENKIVATARILPPGLSYEETSIGRVVVDDSLRGAKLGHVLMKKSMQFIESKYGKTSVRISAQEHLEKYYQKHGFVSTGKCYLEDNIPHVEMIYNPEN